MGKDRGKKNHIQGRFLALPHRVIDSAAYIDLSFTAKGLLVDIARQYAGVNNGQLLCTLSALKERGWTSNDTLHRARRELEEAGLIQLTRFAMKPRRAAWWGLCWLPLDYDPVMDIKPSDFHKNGFLLKSAEKNALPSAGDMSRPTEPPPGNTVPLVAPPDGSIGSVFG